MTGVLLSMHRFAAARGGTNPDRCGDAHAITRGETFRLGRSGAAAAMTIGGERAEHAVGDGDGRRGREAIAGHAERDATEEERRSHSSMAANPGVMRSSTPRGPRAR